MVSGDLIEWAKGIAIFGGVIVGIYAVFSPSYVWHVQQKFGWGGGVLCGFGTVLILGSIFHNVTLNASMTKIELKLAQIQSELEKTTTAVASLDGRVSQVSTAANVVHSSDEKIVSLQRDLKNISDALAQVSKTSNAALTQVEGLNAQLKTTGSGNSTSGQFQSGPSLKDESGKPGAKFEIIPQR